MGTRADFYIGTDPETMEWLGSVAWDGGDIDGLEDVLIEEEYRELVQVREARRHDFTHPDMGWPWPWDNSATTDVAYAWVEEDARAYQNWGRGWLPLGELIPDEYFDRPKDDSQFPDMSDRKNVTLGDRSGVMIIGLDGGE